MFSHFLFWDSQHPLRDQLIFTMEDAELQAGNGRCMMHICNGDFCTYYTHVHIVSAFLHVYIYIYICRMDLYIDMLHERL